MLKTVWVTGQGFWKTLNFSIKKEGYVIKTVSTLRG